MIGGYCVTAYVLVNVFYLAVWCRPFNGYWAVPVKHGEFSWAWNATRAIVLGTSSMRRS